MLMSMDYDVNLGGVAVSVHPRDISNSHPASPASNMEQSLQECMGDIELLMIMVILPRVLHLVEIMPRKLVRSTRYLEPAAEVGWAYYLVSTLDEGIKKHFKQASSSPRTTKMESGVLFVMLWRVPSRALPFYHVMPYLDWPWTSDISVAVLERWLLAAILYLGCCYLAEKCMELNVTSGLKVVLLLLVSAYKKRSVSEELYNNVNTLQNEFAAWICGNFVTEWDGIPL